MAAYKYVNTDDEGMGTYSDTPSGKSRVVGGTQSKAGAGRGGQGGPTAKQANEGNMTSAEREALQETKDAKASEAIKGMGYAKGGSVSASKRADGIAQRGKTKGRMVMCGGGKVYK